MNGSCIMLKMNETVFCVHWSNGSCISGRADLILILDDEKLTKKRRVKKEEVPW